LSENARQKLEVERKQCTDALFAYMCRQFGTAGPAKFGILLTIVERMFMGAAKKRERLTYLDVMNKLLLAPITQEIVLQRSVLTLS
jgi:hypothetical protein